MRSFVIHSSEVAVSLHPMAKHFKTAPVDPNTQDKDDDQIRNRQRYA